MNVEQKLQEQEWVLRHDQLKRHLENYAPGKKTGELQAKAKELFLAQKAQFPDREDQLALKTMYEQVVREVIASQNVKAEDVKQRRIELNSVKDAYALYRRLRDSNVAADAPEVARLFDDIGGIKEQLKRPTGANWTDPTGVEDYFHSLYDLESKLKSVTTYADLDEVQRLFRRAKNAEDNAGGTIVTSTRILLNEYAEKINQLEVKLQNTFSKATLTEIGNKDKKTKESLEKLIQLFAALEQNRTRDPDQIERAVAVITKSKEDYEKARDQIVESTFVKDFNSIEPYLEFQMSSFAEMVIREMNAFIGSEEGLNVPFSKKTEVMVNEWAEYQLTYDSQWTVQELWNKVCQVWGKDNLTRSELESLSIYKKSAESTLVNFVTNNKGDANYQEKFQFLQVMRNRINFLMDKFKYDPSAPVTRTGSRELTVDEIFKVDLETIKDPEVLYLAAKKLWGRLFNGTETSKSNNRAKDNARYDQIIQVLEQKRDALPDGLDKEKIDIKVRYLRDRRSVWDALCIGTSSAMTLDYDTFTEGGGGWYGAKVPSEFDAGEILRLLYGNKLDEVNLNSVDSEEKERIRATNLALNIMCDYYSEYGWVTIEDEETKKLTSGWKKGNFHATLHFNEAKKKDFRKVIAATLKTDLGVSSLSDVHQEALELAWWLGALLDLRTYYAMPFYMAGWSPKDDINKTIGKTAERLANGKTLYVICGKGQSLIDPPAVAARPSEAVYNASENKDKLDILTFSVEHATPIWWGFMAPHLDEHEEKESLKVVPQLSNDMYVPGMHAAFFVPNNSGLTKETRDKIIASTKTGGGDSENSINLAGLLSGSKAAQEFAKACLDGFVPSGDHHKDIELIKDKASEIANKISPTKALGTINGRVLANYLYSYCRMALVSFGKKYSEKLPQDDYQRAYAEFLMALRSGIGAAETNKITIADHLLPAEFRSKYGLPQSAPITVLAYVLALLPDGKPIPGFGGGKFYVTPFQPDKDKPIPSDLLPRPVSAEVARQILAAAKYDALREKNNKELLDHAQGKAHTYRQMLNQKIEQKLMGGNSSPLLHHHEMFKPRGNKTQVVFYSAMRMPDFAEKDKGPKE